MKRFGNIYQNICTIENLTLAEKNARKGKKHQHGVKVFDRDPVGNILKANEMLVNKTYRTSEYKTFPIYEPKERIIFSLKYFPDRIIQHSAMLQLEPIFYKLYTADTYSCIKGRGIRGAANALKKALKDVPGTTFCLKLDIKKFYPSVDHRILKQLLRRKFKDADHIDFMDEIINSAPGLPIGNYMSQHFANFYLTLFDHWIKEKMRVKYYFRYMDDMVILSDSKEFLHNLLIEIKKYLSEQLNLTVKGNHQVFPVWSRGIDFVGYVFYHTHIRLRKTIKKNFARMIALNKNEKSINSYMGWLMYGNCNHLIKTLLNEAV